MEGPTGLRREVSPPWRTPTVSAWPCRVQHADQERHRERLRPRGAVRPCECAGDALFGLLFDEAGVARLREAMIPNGPRPLVVLRSGDDTLLSLPWELLRLDGAFLVRDRRIDLVRCTSGQVGTEELPREPSGPFELVVNVSAPEGSTELRGGELPDHQGAHRALPLVPTELGTLADLVETVARERPTGIHFSGHGARDNWSSKTTRAARLGDDKSCCRSCAIGSPMASCRRSSTWPVATATPRRAREGNAGLGDAGRPAAQRRRDSGRGLLRPDRG